LGSFKAASSRLNAPASTVSTRIQELEEHFGARLLDRRRRTVRLTAKGSELMAYAERLLNLAAEMEESVSKAAAVSGLVRVGVSEVVSATWLPKLIAVTHDRYPRISVEYDVDLAAPHLQKLRKGDLDLLLEPKRMSMGGHVLRSLGSTAFHWMASPALELPLERPMRSSDFRELQIFALSKDSNNWQTMDSWFRLNAATPQRVTYCNSLNVIAAHTVAAQGVALLPVCMYERMLEEGVLQLIRTTPVVPVVEFGAIVENEQPSLTIRLIADLAASVSDFATTRSRERSARKRSSV
jgi:DNA-binding transcriptional LysR family regulator